MNLKTRKTEKRGKNLFDKITKNSKFGKKQILTQNLFESLNKSHINRYVSPFFFTKRTKKKI